MSLGIPFQRRNPRRSRKQRHLLERLEDKRLLAGDLVGHWNADSLNALDDLAAVPSWIDSVGASTATSRGTPILVKNQLGGRSVVRFDASDGDDSLRVPLVESPIGKADDFSIAVTFATSSQDLPGDAESWFKGAGLVDAYGLGLSSGWGVAINSTGQVGAGLEGGFGGSVTSLFSTASNLNDGNLHTVVVTRRGGTLTIYVDDVSVDAIDDASDAPRSDADISFGDVLPAVIPGSTAGTGFTGDIADIRMFNGALEAGEVANLQADVHTYYNNQPPTAQADVYDTEEDAFLFAIAANEGVLKNDTDLEGDQLTAILITEPEHGLLNLKADGSFVYDADSDFFGTDRFTYAAVDFRSSDPVTVTINVANTYDVAVALPDAYKTLPSQDFAVDSVNGVLGNDTNLDQVTLKAVLVEDVPSGNLVLSENGSFSYNSQGFTGVTTFKYQIDDGTGLSNVETVTLTVNTPPVATNDNFEIAEDTLLSKTVADGVLANDTDAEGDQVIATLIETTKNGELIFMEDGSFSYQPSLNYVGPDSFSYQLADFADSSGVATVALNITAVNDPPVANGDLYLTFVGEPLSVSGELGVLTNDTDVENADLHATLIRQAANGVAELAADGSLNYTPTAGFEGVDSFTYQISDGEADSEETVVTLIVAPTDQQVVINEVHYDPPDNTIPAEFIELYNQGTKPADVSNWFFTDGVSYVIPEGTVIPPLGYLVVAQDPATLKTEFNADAIGPYSGRLSSEGEDIRLRNAAGDVVDLVDYRQGFPWPVAAGGDGPSMELINPALDNSLGGSWRSADAPTPGAANSAFAMNAAPQTRQVNHTPQEPSAGQETTITAKVTDPNGVQSVQVEYQLVLPGQYIPYLLPLPIRDLRRTPDAPREINPEYTDPANWTQLTMVDDGTGQDATAGDGIYTATIPGQEHRTLVRYRITVTDTLNESITLPYDDDASRNFAYFAYNGVPDYNGHSAVDLQTVPVYQLIARNEDVTTMMAYSGRDQISQGTQARFAYAWPSTFVYDGVVYDNINMRLRGANGRYHLAGKRSMRFRFNDGHYLAAKNQDGEPFENKWRTLTTGKMFDNRQTQTWALNENINMYLFNQLGVPASETYYVHFRVIDGEEEAPDQWSGDFWGLNFIIETYDVRFLDHHGLERGNMYKLINQTRDWEQQQRYQAPSAVNDGSDHDNIERNLRGRSTAEFIDAHVELENYYLYHAFTEAIRHYDYWPDANKNMVYYFEPEYLPENDNLGKLWILPWDTDASWGPTWNQGHDVVYNSIFAATGGGADRDSTPELWPAYFNTVREIRDLLWQRDQIEPLVDQFAAVLKPLEQADLDRWLGGPREEGRHTGLSGAGRDGIDALVQDMKNFAFEGGNWPGGGVGQGGTARHLDQLQGRHDEDEEIPATPTITYEGDPNFAADGLRFRTSDFVDPQGNDSFGAIEWRIAEVTDPNAPAFDPTAKLHLEWNASWESGELTEFGAEMTPPTSAVTAGHAYRARVRMLDDTGRWSHWSDPIQFIATAATSSELLDALRISEIHYHPADPSQAEVTAGFNDADDFEFLELVNIGNQTIDLTGAELVRAELNGDSQGLEFNFADGTLTQLAPGDRVLVVEDVEAFQHRYGENLPVTGQWSGALSNGGEQLTLLGDGFTIHQFAYSDDWYPTTDGDGASLELNDARNPNLDSWAVAASWSASVTGGTPGTAGDVVVVGDSNGDGVFDSGDLVAVFTAGEYEDDIEDNSTFSEGDWDGDGDFTTSDFVFAMRAGTYRTGAGGRALNLDAIAAGLASDRHTVRRSNEVLGEAKPIDAELRRQSELLLQTRERLFADYDPQLAPDDRSSRDSDEANPFGLL